MPETEHSFPPSLIAQEAERAALGCALQDAEAARLVGTLAASDWHYDEHRAVWRAVAGCLMDGEAVDRLTVYRRLAPSGEGPAMVSSTLLLDLEAAVVTAVHAKDYVATVRRVGDARRAYLALRGAADRIAGGEADPVQAVGDLTRDLAEVSSSQNVVRSYHLAEVLKTWERSVDAGPPPVVRTPFSDINRSLGGGFRPGELIYIGGRAGTGKTALALELARSAAADGVPVLFVSREMLAQSLAERMIAQTCRIEALSVRSGTLSPTDWPEYARGRTHLQGLPLWITDEALTVDQVDGMLSHQSFGLLIVDYLQLLHAPRTIKERRLQVEHVSSALKTLALQRRLPVICLSSLSRAEQGNRDRRPQLSDLRESGELEHDADVIFLLHRAFQSEDCEVILAKNRSGRVGITTLRFRPEYVAFEVVPV